jgi:glucokinase
MSDQTVVALDAGGNSVKSALVAASIGIVGDVCVDAVQSKASAAGILHTLAVIIANHLKTTGEVSGIAFAFPGPFDYERGICLIQNQEKYDALYGIDVSANLRKILGLPKLVIRYRNDAQAAILGEALYGAGRPYTRLLGLTLGTGLGSAFVASGRLVTESPDVPDQGWLYSFPYDDQRADDVFSTRGLLGRLQARGIQAADIASALQVTDEDSNILAESFASFGADLGTFLKPFASNFRADGVLVTGGIAEAWDHFAPSLIKSLSVPVLRGALGNRAALLGAATIYFKITPSSKTRDMVD